MNNTPTNPAPKSGTDYQALVDANPYATGTRKQTGWDRFVNKLGFTSGYDRYEAEREQNSKNYLAQIYAAQREEMYNSAIEQAERQRAAGINPDITGGVDSGAAAGSPEEFAPVSDMSDAIQSGADDMDNFGSLVSLGVSALTGTLGVVDSISAIVKRGREVESVDYAIGSSMPDFVVKVARMFSDSDMVFSPEVKKRIEAGESPESVFDDAFGNILSGASISSEYARPWFRSKRLNDVYNQKLKSFRNSDVYKNYIKEFTNRYRSNIKSDKEASAEFNAFMSSYDDYVSIINENYFPKFAESYKYELEKVRVDRKQNKLTENQIALTDEEIAGKRAKAQAQAVVLRQISAHIKSSNGLPENLYWNTIFNSMSTDYINTAIDAGLDIASDLLDIINVPNKVFHHLSGNK